MVVQIHKEETLFKDPTKGDSIHIFNNTTLEQVGYHVNFGIFYVKEGIVDTKINDRKVRLVGGDLIFMLLGSAVISSSVGKFTGISIFMACDDDVWPESIFKNKDAVSKGVLKIALTDFYLHHRKKSIPDLKHYLNFLMGAPENIQKNTPIEAVSRMIRTDIVKYYTGSFKVQRKRFSTQLHILKRMEDIESELRNNCQSGFSLTEIANKSMMSKFELIRNFKALYRVTPHQYYIQQKIALAKRYLYQGFPVNAVAHLCGYPDLYSFSKQFKLVEGFAPSRIISNEKICQEKK